MARCANELGDVDEFDRGEVGCEKEAAEPVARRMSFTIRWEDDLGVPDFWLISTPRWHIGHHPLAAWTLAYDIALYDKRPFTRFA